MKLLLVAAPLQDFHSPYPATAHLTGFLRSRGHDVVQDDLSIRVITRLLSSEGARELAEDIRGGTLLFPKGHVELTYFLEHFERYASAIDPVLQFLRGKDPGLKHRLVRRNLIPESPAYRALIDGYAQRDRGRVDPLTLATRYANTLVFELFSIVKSFVDPQFEISAYAESLGDSIAFDPLERRLAKRTLIDRFIESVTREQIAAHQPDVVGISIPFQGQIYGALRVAKAIKAVRSDLPVVFGGGFCNTALRDVTDARLFSYIDYMTLDDGERPIECLLEHLSGQRPKDALFRTFALDEGKVRYITTNTERDVPHKDVGTPTFEGLPLDLYFPILKLLMEVGTTTDDTSTHRPEMADIPWSYRWNKLTLAHGCYWRKCTFCDIHLDYIGRYDKVAANVLLDRMATLSRETGWSTFHFTDEACPPAVLHALSRQIRERNLTFTWYGNIRFDKAFTREVTDEMAAAGCIAVTGGLEVASDRLLKLMEKGTTLHQVARVCRALTESQILVHAYLIYGFPTQTEQEVIDSLEVVRQFFAVGLLASAVWHRFGVTAHSPIGRDPEKYQILLRPRPPGRHGTFANYLVPHEDRVPVRYRELSRGLHAATANYGYGGVDRGLERCVTTWFDSDVPKPTIPPDLIERLSREPLEPLETPERPSKKLIVL